MNSRFYERYKVGGETIVIERLTLMATPETLDETLESLYLQGYGVSINCMANGQLKLNAVKLKRVSHV